MNVFGRNVVRPAFRRCLSSVIADVSDNVIGNINIGYDFFQNQPLARRSSVSGKRLFITRHSSHFECRAGIPRHNPKTIRNLDARPLARHDGFCPTICSVPGIRLQEKTRCENIRLWLNRNAGGQSDMNVAIRSVTRHSCRMMSSPSEIQKNQDHYFNLSTNFVAKMNHVETRRPLCGISPVY
jgi:hypothetical protein